MEKEALYKEPSRFYNKKPWMVWRYEGDITVPSPHFADTIEFDIYENGMRGNLYIGGKHINLTSDAVIFIAPKVIHSLQYTDVKGSIIAIKINPAALKPLFDIEAFLALHGISWLDLPILLPRVNEIKDIAYTLKNANNTGNAIIAIIKIFQLLIECTNISENNHNERISSSNKAVQDAITWTEENFQNKISLDKVAETIGYTKNHFCRKFKELTGLTYWTYLNNLRISHAKKLLKRGYSVGEVCNKCGFEDTSYFISLFRKNVGMTPRKYISSELKNS